MAIKNGIILELAEGMTIGWIKDTDGKWYYMYSDGSMAYDTYIDRYYVNFNGAYKEY